MIQEYRTIFISDVHLATKGCQVDVLLLFLKYTNSEYLILLGDIIDFWAIKRSLFWPITHNTVIVSYLCIFM